MKHKTEWNLGLLYKGPNDPQIEKDMRAIEASCSRFEKKYKSTLFTKNVNSLSTALKDYEKLLIATTYKPLHYLRHYKDIDTANEKIGAMAAQMDQRQRNAFNKVLFFEIELSKIPKEKQTIILKHPSVSYYRYYLQKIFARTKYMLSEEEEKLLSLVSQPAGLMWFEAQQKLLSQQTVIYKGKEIPLTQATEMYISLPKPGRSILYKEIIKARKATSYLAGAELNAIYTFKKISDEKRGYKKPYSETILRYENDEKEIEQLVTTITKGFKISNRFYKLHAKLIDQKQLNIEDIYAPIGQIKEKFDFESAVRIVKNAFTRFDKKYADLLDKYLENGQIDVFPRPNKRGGGYSSGLGKLPVYILLNHVEKLESVETLAHEMGHSIHTELSMHHDPIYGDYTISVAEVASTFFERFVTDELIKMLPDDQKLILMHQRTSRDISVIFRQITCFNCQLELETLVREKGMLSKVEMAQIMQKHLKSYLGDAVNVTEDDGYIFTAWAHLRYSFYVYTYAYGHLISNALYESWEKDNRFKDKVEKFLSAGSTMSPKDIFKSIGINTNAAFFEAGLKALEKDITAIEQLAKKQKRI